MCTSGQNSRGSCFGDSGGPAIVKNDEGFYVQVLFFIKSCSSTYNTIAKLILFQSYPAFPHIIVNLFQVGIVSFGGGICEEGYPSGQVLVHKFSDWIEAVTGLKFQESYML